MSQQLPTHPNLDHLKKQAKDVLRVFRRQKPRWKLADAQRALAHGYGFVNWTSLKTHVETIRHEQRLKVSTPAQTLEPNDSSITKASLRRKTSSREDYSLHPIVGAWVAEQVMSSASDPQRHNEIVVEFQTDGEEIKLTQVGIDTTGHDVAITTTICADGQEYTAPFGESARLKALWTTSLTLEATFTTREQTTSKWTYEVSPDEKSLIISTATDRIVFRRL